MFWVEIRWWDALILPPKRLCLCFFFFRASCWVFSVFCIFFLVFMCYSLFIWGFFLIVSKIPAWFGSSAHWVRLVSGTQASKGTFVHQVQPLSWTWHPRSLLISRHLPTISFQLEREKQQATVSLTTDKNSVPGLL